MTNVSPVTARERFEAEDEARAPVQVSFGTDAPSARQRPVGSKVVGEAASA